MRKTKKAVPTHYGENLGETSALPGTGREAQDVILTVVSGNVKKVEFICGDELPDGWFYLGKDRLGQSWDVAAKFCEPLNYDDAVISARNMGAILPGILLAAIMLAAKNIGGFKDTYDPVNVPGDLWAMWITGQKIVILDEAKPLKHIGDNKVAFRPVRKSKFQPGEG